MDEIERAIVLPKGAESLNAYGRNYAFSGRKTIAATYLIPSSPHEMSEGCDVMLEDFSSRPCTKEEIKKSADTDARYVAAQTPAGIRRWYDDSRILPFINDGGCLQINVQYDITTHHVLSVACNGYA